MALLIPTERRHVVRPGESLWRIAALYGTTVDAIARENRLTNVNLIYPGQSLVIPRGTRPVIEANAYQANLATGDVSATAGAAPYLTYIAMFSAAITEDGDVLPPRAESFIERGQSGWGRRSAHADQLPRDPASAPTWPASSSQRGGRPAGHRRTGDHPARSRVCGPQRRLRVRLPLRPGGLQQLPAPPAAPAAHGGAQPLHAVAPKVSAEQPGLLYEAHDYPVHGEVCDFVVLMTYEWGYVTGPPMAIAPLRQVRQVLDYAVTAIPPRRS